MQRFHLHPLLIVVAVLFVPSMVWAQGTPVVPPVAGETNTEMTEQATDTPIRADRTGRGARVVLEGKDAEEYLRRLPGLQQFQISSLEISGTTDDKTARLTATLKIHIDEEFDDLWVRVPVALAEATLTGEAIYQGNGKHRFDAEGFANQGRRAWFIKGAGNHVLTLPLIVSLSQRVHTRRRLRLTLPTAASSHFSFELPHQDVRIETSADSRDVQIEDEEKTTVDLYGLGSEFDLSWEQVPKLRTTGSRIQLGENRIIADLSRSQVELTALQTISAASGSFEQLVFTLPKGIAVNDITERRDVAAEQYLREYKVETVGDQTRVTVMLSRPCTDSLKLNWVLDPVTMQVPGKVEFKAIRLEGVTVNTGDVEVIAPAGSQIEKVDGLDVLLTTVTSALTKNQIATAYKMISNESRLQLDVREIKPRFTMTPEVRLDASDGTLQLRAAFRCGVLRGALKRVEMAWPGYVDEEWDPIEVKLDGDKLADWTHTFTDDGRLLIQFEDRQSREFEFAMTCKRALPQVVRDGIEATIDVSLPAMVTGSGGLDRQLGETTLIVSEAADLAFRLMPTESTSVTPEPLRPENQTAQELDARQRAYRVNSQSHQFTATLSEQQRSITASTSVSVSIKAQQARVEQRLAFAVDYRRLNELQLEVPESISERIELWYGDKRLPQLRSTAFAQKVSLPENIVGPFEILAVYSVERNSVNDTTELALPLLKSPDVEFDSTGIEVSSELLNAEPANQSIWTRKAYSESGNLAWETSADVDAVQLKLTADTTRPEHRYSVRLALVQTAIDGAYRSRVQFSIDGIPEELKLVIPAECKYDRMFWNGRAIEPVTTETEESGLLVTLQIPSVYSTQANALRIDYHSDADTTAGWYAQHTLMAPGFPNGVWVDETEWQVFLGGQQMLLNFDPSYSSRYKWGRDGFVWHRQSTPKSARGFDNMGIDGPVRSYVVARLGQDVPLKIYTLHRTFMFLVGAIVALVFGFVLFRLSRARAFALIGVAAVAVSIASMVWPVLVEVFVQPALVGLAMACIAAAVEWISQNRRGVRKRPLPQLGDMTLVPSTNFTGSPVAVAASDDRTVIRSAGGGSQTVVPGIKPHGSSTGAAGS